MTRDRYSSGAQMVSWLFEVQANPKYNWKTEFPGMTIKGGVLMSGGTSYHIRHARSRRAASCHATSRHATRRRTLCTDSNRTAFLCVRDAGTYQCYSDPNDPNYPAQPIGSCKGCTSPSPGFCSPQNADGFNATKCSTCNPDVVPYVSTTLRCVSYQSVRMDSFSYSPLGI